MLRSRAGCEEFLGIQPILRGVWGLRYFAVGLLAPPSLAAAHYFRSESIRKPWSHLLGGIVDCRPKFWGVTAFQVWMESIRC